MIAVNLTPNTSVEAGIAERLATASIGLAQVALEDRAEARITVGRGIDGGIGFATACTIFLTPVFYRLIATWGDVWWACQFNGVPRTDLRGTTSWSSATDLLTRFEQI